MKTKKILLSILAPTALIVPTISALAVTSCGPTSTPVKAAEASTFFELMTAIEDETIVMISITDDINVGEFTGDCAIEINRTISIEGNGHMIYSTNQNTTNQAALVCIKQNPAKPNELINVTFHNVNLAMKSKAYGGCVVSILDAEGCTVNFNQTSLLSQHAEGYNSYYALRIRAGIRKLGCTINISNGSEFKGWGAIYNGGSRVKLNARNSTFIGANNYEAGELFATITVSDYPFIANHTLGAYNDFNFSNCIIKATALNQPSTMPETQQFLIQSRSPACNVVNVDTATYVNSSSYLPESASAAWFACATENYIDITDENILTYWRSGKAWDLPTYVNCVDAFNEEFQIYNKKISHFLFNGKPVYDHDHHFHYYQIIEGAKGSHLWGEY